MSDLVDTTEKFWNRRSKWRKGLITGGFGLILPRDSRSAPRVTVATVHIDGVLLQPTVELDERPLIREGELRSPRESQTMSGSHQP